MCVLNRRRFIVFLQFLLLAAKQASGQFNYDQQGRDWAGTCATGRSQSPIRLADNTAIRRPIPRIRFTNYNRALQSPLIMTNNGHTANIVLPPTNNGQRASIQGGLLPGTFEAQSVHFHWGSANSRGSEHLINGQRYDVEMHIVHKNVRYATVAEASLRPDGLAVLGVMLQAVPTLISTHFGLNRILDRLPQVIRDQSSTMIAGQLTMNDLLGRIPTGRFYSYNGSLTTPDCAESVTWTVFSDSVKLPRPQIAKFWDLPDERSLPLINNYRHPQEINGRPIFQRTLI
ncbi:carbonic anhydrase 13 isoform X1 [Drosophila grimshawi]|uniref:carbonic anhydrase 13 isoform X1 n=1 Tax=Drosophila grimshawi TaxID=7222 RepID=UPI001C934DAF|nr:carbonic anhydrase 13 isoform X1 [Drosophila grimshawi]